MPDSAASTLHVVVDVARTRQVVVAATAPLIGAVSRTTTVGHADRTRTFTQRRDRLWSRCRCWCRRICRRSRRIDEALATDGTGGGAHLDDVIEDEGRRTRHEVARRPGARDIPEARTAPLIETTALRVARLYAVWTRVLAGSRRLAL